MDRPRRSATVHDGAAITSAPSPNIAGGPAVVTRTDVIET
jgi:hypothetical protein